MSRVYINGDLRYDSGLTKVLGDALERLGLIKLIDKGQKVMLKVNVAGPFPVEQAATTNPEMVRAMVRLIKEVGSTPVIGDGPNSNQPCFSICGLKQLAEEEAVELVRFKNYAPVETDGEIYKSINYASEIFDADKVISMAKLKTHTFAYYTGAVKNMFGAVEPKQRKEMHLHNNINEFSNILVDVFNARKPDIAIMDGITAMEGLGPTHGHPKELGVIACSSDAFALDKVCSEAIGYTADQIPVLKQGERRGLITFDADAIEIIGSAGIDTSEFKRVPVHSDIVHKRFVKMSLGNPAFKHDKCIKCGLCAEVCPAEAIEMTEKLPGVKASKCINCYCCHELCPIGAVVFENRL